jgi:hypothetical protein
MKKTGLKMERRKFCNFLKQKVAVELKKKRIDEKSKNADLKTKR